MELPKNITQIGESDRSCKIYVEDYVISYMKQMNLLAQNKDMAVALYGVRKEENEVSYLFCTVHASWIFCSGRADICPRHSSRKLNVCGKNILRIINLWATAS